MKLRLFFIAAFLVLTSCTASKISQAQIDALETMLTKKNIYFTANTASPQLTNAVQNVLNSPLMRAGDRGGNINIAGDGYFLKLINDSIASYLPYYGERRMLVGYGTNNSGIKLSGEVKNYNVKPIKNGGYTIFFEAKSDIESFNAKLDIYPNLKAYLYLTSAARSSIYYSGELIKEDKK